MSTRRASFISPRSPVFWVMTGLIVYGASAIGPEIVASTMSYPVAGLVSAGLWTLYGALLLLLLYRLELFERRSPTTIAGAFLWGGLAATGIAVAAAPAMANLVESALGDELADWTSAIAAPLVEEPLKLLGVVGLALIPGAHVRTPLDGLFYGLVVGLGFEVVESLLYTDAAMNDLGGTVEVAVAMLLARGVIGGLWSHPSFSGVAGSGVGYFVGSRRPLAWRLTVAISALMAAVVLHALFDSPLFEGLVGYIASGLPIIILLTVLLFRTRGDERQRFDAVADYRVDRSLISDDERLTLQRPRLRRRARRQAARQLGRKGRRAMADLQSAQIDLVDAVMDDGVGSERYEEAVRLVNEARSRLG